jgi:eukaryotic-like serine/threonine-protein kinase
LLAYASDRAGNGDLDIWIQQMSGGTPLRLTDDPADDSMPDFSPDGSQLVFRSERNGGGIYLVPALGGPARLIAADGRQPRFSPDGSRLAYWTGQFRGENLGTHLSNVFVMPLSGGSVSRLIPDFDVAANPLWTSDGRSLIVAGHPKGGSSLREGFDWWAVPVDGKPPVKTGVFDTALLRGTLAIAPGAWLSGGIVFSLGDDLWRVMLSTSGRAEGSPQRLTLGVGPYTDPATDSGGQIVFARLVTQRIVERASLTNTAEVPVRLYSDGGATTWRASSTPDGEKIVIERDVGAARELWIKNTVSGRQEMIVRVPSREGISATISADGTKIAYTGHSGANGNLSGTGFIVEASGGVPRQVCDACTLYGFLGDNTRVLAATADGHAIRAIDSRTGVARDIVVTRDGRLDRPHASPDDRLLAFRRNTGSIAKSYVTRFPANQPVPAENAAPIDEPTVTGRPTGWSLDSRTVYLLLDADGFRCVWGQRVDPATGALIGKPAVVRHFHRVNGMSTSFGNAVTQRGFLFEAADATSNLWKFRPALRH